MHTSSKSQVRGQCPVWCAGHLPMDQPVEGGTVHISAERAVPTKVGGEQHEFYVSVESVDDGPAAVRLEGASSAPMTPLQALELADFLRMAARRACEATSR